MANTFGLQCQVCNSHGLAARAVCRRFSLATPTGVGKVLRLNGSGEKWQHELRKWEKRQQYTKRQCELETLFSRFFQICVLLVFTQEGDCRQLRGVINQMEFNISIFFTKYAFWFRLVAYACTIKILKMFNHFWVWVMCEYSVSPLKILTLVYMKILLTIVQLCHAVVFEKCQTTHIN